jgi:hypothetical protein
MSLGLERQSRFPQHVALATMRRGTAKSCGGLVLSLSTIGLAFYFASTLSGGGGIESDPWLCHGLVFLIIGDVGMDSIWNVGVDHDVVAAMGHWPGLGLSWQTSSVWSLFFHPLLSLLLGQWGLYSVYCSVLKTVEKCLVLLGTLSGDLGSLRRAWHILVLNVVVFGWVIQEIFVLRLLWQGPFNGRREKASKEEEKSGFSQHQMQQTTRPVCYVDRLLARIDSLVKK